MSRSKRRKSSRLPAVGGEQRTRPARKDADPSGLDATGQQEIFPELGREGVEYLHVEATRFLGPLPPPDMLLVYERAVAGLGTTIVQNWTGEQQHRHTMEKRYLDLDAVGLVAGLVVAMTVILGGFYIILQGAEAAGIAAVLAPVATIVGAFVYAVRHKRTSAGAAESPEAT